MKKSSILKFMNFWPPFLGAGIRITKMSKDMRHIEVKLKGGIFNRNYVGVHFGGSLYAMTDPFYMLMLIENLGPGYVVWDKASTIKFRRPGRGTVTAKFDLSQEQIDAIRFEADREGKAHPTFRVEILNKDSELVAEVDKLLSIKPKKKA